MSKCEGFLYVSDEADADMTEIVLDIQMQDRSARSTVIARCVNMTEIVFVVHRQRPHGGNADICLTEIILNL